MADDLIEPYRPLVDLFVAIYDWNSYENYELTPALKRQLFNLTNYLVLQNEKKLRVMTSVDRSAATLAASILEERNQMTLPELLPLEEGGYE